MSSSTPVTAAVLVPPTPASNDGRTPDDVVVRLPFTESPTAGRSSNPDDTAASTTPSNAPPTNAPQANAPPANAPPSTWWESRRRSSRTECSSEDWR